MTIDNSYGMTLDDTDILYEKKKWKSTCHSELTAGFQLSLWFAPYPQS